MKLIDRLTEHASRRLAQSTSRRSFVTGLGTLLVGVSSLPLLPVARAATEKNANNQAEPGDPGDPNSCDYWRYCSIDGFLCGCCGGSVNACPPGAEMAPVTWIGTCRNPADGKNYIISYNDCCGKASCGNCLCTRNEGDRPVYRPHTANDINWCVGTQSAVYHCTVSVILGVATDQ